MFLVDLRKTYIMRNLEIVVFKRNLRERATPYINSSNMYDGYRFNSNNYEWADDEETKRAYPDDNRFIDIDGDSPRDVATKIINLSKESSFPPLKRKSFDLKFIDNGIKMIQIHGNDVHTFEGLTEEEKKEFLERFRKNY